MEEKENDTFVDVPNWFKNVFEGNKEFRTAKRGMKMREILNTVRHSSSPGYPNGCGCGALSARDKKKINEFIRILVRQNYIYRIGEVYFKS